MFEYVIFSYCSRLYPVLSFLIYSVPSATNSLSKVCTAVGK